jgi:LacI family transcriptional regulator
VGAILFCATGVSAKNEAETNSMDKEGRKDEERSRRVRKVSAVVAKLSDVATRAGVSTASVSRSINFPETVSEEVRLKVAFAMQELNWIPHGAARALASRRTGIVGAIIPALGHQNFATVIEALQEGLQKGGYTLLLGVSNFSPERELEQARRMVERGVECLVVLGEQHAPKLYSTLEAHNIPCLVLYTTGRGSDRACIGFDNYAASRRLVQYLLDLGHREFGMIAHPAEGNDRIQQRLAAVRETLAEQGRAIRPAHFAAVPMFSLAFGRQGLAEILGARPCPTAILCTNDYLAAGAILEARARGVAVPQDISIAGFDDIELAAHLDPPLTTVRVPDLIMGERAAQHIVSLLRGEAPPPPLEIEAPLIVRGSTGPPPADADRSRVAQPRHGDPGA